MTNTVYIISNSDCNLKPNEPRKILLRIYGEGVDNILNRSQELEWFIKLSAARAGPKLLASFANGRIEEYIESVTLTPRMMRNPEVSSLIAKSISKFHKLKVPFDKTDLVLWKRIEDWRHEAKKSFKLLLKRQRSSGSLEILDRIKEYEIFNEKEFEEETGKFKKYFDKLVQYNFPIVPCHNDLQHGNILLKDSNEIVLIDYEYGGMNYAPFDIANHFCEWASDFTDENLTPHIMNFTEHYPSIRERENFLRLYLSENDVNSGGNSELDFSLDDNIHNSDISVSIWLQAVEDFKEISHLLWAYWGIIQANNSTIDFDYLGYALMRLEAMKI